MLQQINLYQRPRRVSTVLSAHSLLLAASLVWITLLGIWGYGQFAVSRLQQQVNLYQQQQQVQQQLLQASDTFFAGKVDAVALRAQVQQLRQVVQQRQQGLQLLRSRAPVMHTGFAERLTALARSHVDGVWLEEVSLNALPGIQRLDGRSLTPTLVADYLSALRSEAALAGTRFSEVRILGPKYEDSAQADADSSAAVEKSSQSMSQPHAVRFSALAAGAT